ncbi:DUF1761 domain-containing protein [Chlamydiales bacterium]|nr:DUF1761 domain-containing protein [Chlamydiales bacterium]
MIFGEQIHWLPIVVMAVIWVIFGAIWYSPQVCGKLKMSCCSGKDDKCSSNCVQNWVGALVVAFISTFAISLFVQHTGAKTFLDGMIVGFWLWLGFVATTHFQKVLWEKHNMKTFLVDAVYSGIAIVAIGGFLAAW